MRRICPNCGHDAFYAFMPCRVKTMVDSDGMFLALQTEKDVESSIYDAGPQEGPYTCTKCGATYQKWEELLCPEKSTPRGWHLVSGTEYQIARRLSEGTWEVYEVVKKSVYGIRGSVSHQVIRESMIDDRALVEYFGCNTMEGLMKMLSLTASDVPEDLLRVGAWAEMHGPEAVITEEMPVTQAVELIRTIAGGSDGR